MAKFISIAIVLVIFAVCSAQPQRSKLQLRNRSRFLARQEFAEDVPAVTPYPSAGNVPDVAFDLPGQESELIGGRAVIGAPDLTYGPPQNGVDSEGEQEDLDVEPESQRLTSIRKKSRFIKSRGIVRAAPLQQAAPLAAVPQLLQLQAPQQPQVLAQPILLADGRIVYSVLA